MECTTIKLKVNKKQKKLTMVKREEGTEKKIEVYMDR